MIKQLRFLLLSMMVMLGSMAYADDVIWQEDFTQFEKNAVPSGGDYNYVCEGSGTKIYSDTYAGGMAPELLVAKNGGSFSATIKLGGKSGDMKLTFKHNQKGISVLCNDLFANRSGYFPSSSNDGNDYTYPFTVPIGTEEITIIFKQEESSNARLDNIVLYAVGGSQSNPNDSTQVTPTPSDSTQVIANATYVVAGSAETIFGSYWNGNDSTNTMTKQEDGTYVKVYKNVEPTDLVQFKVVENGTNWYPSETESSYGNKLFKVTTACDVTITFNPTTKEVTVAGTGVEELFPSKLQYSAVYVAGDGTNNFPNGEAWNPSAEANKMKSLGNDVWEIQYDGLAQGNYQLKFTIDGKWDVNFGGYFSNFEDVLSLTEHGENIGFSLTDSLTNIVIQLYLNRYNATTKEGAYAIIHKLSAMNDSTGVISGDSTAVSVIKATVAEFNAAAESTDVWYQLTGTVKNLKDGDQYGNFDLEDATDSVYVYGLLSEKGGEKKKFQELAAAKGIKNGSIITIIGNRGSYKDKIEVLNAYFVEVLGTDSTAVTPTDTTAVTPTPTVADNITVEKALALIDSLADGAKSEKKYYVTGKVQKVSSISVEYGNATFTMGNDSINVLTVYRAYGKDNEKITNAKLLKPGDEVTVFGLLQNYVKKDSTGNVITRTPEIAQGGQIIKINGEEYKKDTDTQEELDIITVEQALAIIDTLENGAYAEGEYIVEGYVSKFTESFNPQFGNYTFLLTTNQNDTIVSHALTVYRAKDGNGNKFAEDVLKVGDKVKVQGRLQKYVKNNVITPEIATGGKILTINGETTGITEVKATRPQDNRIYNMNGQRVAIMKKGLYIKNGRKYLAK